MIPKQYRIHLVLMLSVLVIFLYPLLAQQPDDEKEQAASRAAQRFLEQVDADRFAESWEMAAAPMQEKVSRTEWVENLKNFRDRTGPVVSREKSKAVYSPMAHDGEDGEYIVLTYDTVFAKLEDVEETLTVMLTEDGEWRVAGYFIE